MIQNNKLPKIHVSNGLQLDVVPPELQLTDLEQQLIARSLLFMMAKKLPGVNRMKAMFDRVVSVPIEEDDVSRTISALPRHPDDAKVVAVQLKRKLEMKNTHLSEYIRPTKCIKAVEKLKAYGNPFYQNIKVNEKFMEKKSLSQDESILNEVMDKFEKETDSKEQPENEAENDEILDAVKKYRFLLPQEQFLNYDILCIQFLKN